MSKPFIAVSGRRWVGHRIAGFPANFASAEVDLCLADYAKCVDAAGGIALTVPFESDPVAVMAHMDGLILTGGSDVDPRRYGALPSPNLGEVEPLRDAYETALFHAAAAASKPVLAICRGAQLVNVALGGTLVADLPAGVGSGHPAWSFPREELMHGVALTPGSLVSNAFGSSNIMVNTLHHQCVDRPGDGVIVTGVAPDGVIEAYEVPSMRVFAVQWHPELVLAQPDPCFTWLINSASDDRMGWE